MRVSTQIPPLSSVSGMDAQGSSSVVRFCKEPSSQTIRSKELITVLPEMNDLVAYEFIDYDSSDMSTPGDACVKGEVMLPKWNWSVGRVTRTLSSGGSISIGGNDDVKQQHNRFSTYNIKNSLPGSECVPTASETGPQSIIEIMPLFRTEARYCNMPIILKNTPHNWSDKGQGSVVFMKSDKVHGDIVPSSIPPVEWNLATDAVEDAETHHRQPLECNSTSNTTTPMKDLLGEEDNVDKVCLEHIDCAHFSVPISSSPQLILSSAVFTIFDRNALQDAGLVDVHTTTQSMPKGVESVYIPKVLIEEILTNASARWEMSNEGERDVNYSAEFGQQPSYSSFLHDVSDNGVYVLNNNNHKSHTLAAGYDYNSVVQKVLETPLPPAAYKTTKQMDLAKSIGTNPLLVNGLTMAYHEAQDALAIAECQCSILKEEVKRQNVAGFALRCEAEHLEKMLQEYKEEIRLLRENENKLMTAVTLANNDTSSSCSNVISDNSSNLILSNPPITHSRHIPITQFSGGSSDFCDEDGQKGRDSHHKKEDRRRFFMSERYRCYDKSRTNINKDMLLKEDEEITEAVLMANSMHISREAGPSTVALHKQLNHESTAIQRMKDIIDRLRLERGAIWADFESYRADAERELDQIYDAHESLQHRFVDTQKAHLHMEALQRRTQEKADASAKRVTDLVSKFKLIMFRTRILEECINDISDMTTAAALVESDYLAHVQLQVGEQYNQHIEDDSAESKEPRTICISHANMELLRLAVTERVENAGIFVKKPIERGVNTIVPDSQSYAFISQVLIPIKRSASVQATIGDDTRAIINNRMKEVVRKSHYSIDSETSMSDNTPQSYANDAKVLPMEVDSLLFNESTLFEIAEHISTLEKQIIGEKERTSAAEKTLEGLVLELEDVVNSTNEKESLCLCGSTVCLDTESPSTEGGYSQHSVAYGAFSRDGVIEIKEITMRAAAFVATIRDKLARAERLKNTGAHHDVEKMRPEPGEERACKEKTAMEQMMINLKNVVQLKDRELDRFVCLELQFQAAEERIAILMTENEGLRKSHMESCEEHADDLEAALEILEAIILEYEEQVAEEKDRADIEIDFAERALQHAALDIAELKENNSLLMVALDDVIYFAEPIEPQEAVM